MKYSSYAFARLWPVFCLGPFSWLWPVVLYSVWAILGIVSKISLDQKNKVITFGLTKTSYYFRDQIIYQPKKWFCYPVAGP